ncbi:hypothetical protein CLU79DRAFT_798174 [Phycomyces nitens]|nr:hypothetical protein CLU79DRAFT_798174 [Phycomyces nitens]
MTAHLTSSSLTPKHTSTVHTQKSNSHSHNSRTKKAHSSPCLPTTRPVSPTIQSWDDEKSTQSSPLASPLTPPSSPITSPARPSGQAYDPNSRLLGPKRDGNLKALMAEFTSMKKHGTPINLQTYGIVLEAQATLRREGSPLTILKVYDEMCAAHIRPSPHIHTLLIRTLCKRDVEVQKTVAMLKRQSARTGPQGKDDIAFLESENNIGKAMDIFKSAMSIHPARSFDIDLFNQLLRVLSHYGSTVDAMFVYESIEKMSVSPTSATFAALINLFGRAGDLTSALRYFETYISIKSRLGVHDASYVYNALVDSHLKCGLLDGALKVVEQDMVRDNIKLTIIPFNSIIRHYCSHGEMVKAQDLISRLNANPEMPCPDASSYGPILSAYCQSVHNSANVFESASQVYSDLIQVDISKSYGNLANYCLLCISHQQRHKALEVVDVMRGAGLEPDPMLAERIVVAFSSKRETAQAIGALLTMIQSMSTRMILKGSTHLINAASDIIKTASSLRQSLDVLHVMAPVLNSGLPNSLACLLLDTFGRVEYRGLLTASDCTVLCEAALLICDNQGVTSTFEDVVRQILASQHAAALPPAFISHVSAQLRFSGHTELDREWKEALEYCPSQLVHPMSIESESISEELMKLVMRSQVGEAIELLKREFVTKDRVPVAEVMRDAIALAGKQGHLDAALMLYHLSLDCYKSLGNVCRDRAVYMATNSVLIGYAQQGDMVQAKKYYDKLKQMGHYPDSNGYASLLLGSAQCATDEATDALIIHDEARRHGVKPTTFFYNVIISKLAKARKLDNALGLFEEMRQLKVAPNAITYGTVISACVRAGSEVHARRFFGEMLSSSVYQPRVGPFNNMMQFYVRQQPNRERVLEYFGEMRRRHIKPSVHTYKLLMEAYASMAPYDMPMAHRMLHEMERKDRLRPQATHYATLIYAYGTLQLDLKSAERVFEEMLKAKVEPDEAVYQAMLDTLISNDCLERAEAMYQDMLESITKSSSPYIENLFIRGYGFKGQVDKAREVFEAMTDDRQSPLNKGVIREPSTFEAMVRAYLENNMVLEAKQVLDLMVEREFPEKVVAVVADLVLD